MNHEHLPASQEQLLARMVVIVGTLRTGVLLWVVSLALVLAALVVLIAGPQAFSWQGGLALFSLVAAAMQFYYAARVRFDAYVFSQWLHQWQISGQANPEATMAAFDTAVCRQSLPVRALHDRWQGALRLLYCQGICLAVQTVLLMSSILTGYFM